MWRPQKVLGDGFSLLEKEKEKRKKEAERSFAQKPGKVLNPNLPLYIDKPENELILLHSAVLITVE